MARVHVVGAGVVGLTCAVRLAEAGHRVDVVARDLPLETTSAVAAALWYPYLALPHDRVTRWAARSYEVFSELAAERGSGVHVLPGTEVFAARQPDPWWAPAVPSLARVERTTLPEGYDDGWTVRAPVVEMPLYLRWLTARLLELDGTLSRRNLSALPAPGAGRADVVLDCTGLGARLFAGDHSVVPVRGQVVLLEQVGLARWWLAGLDGRPLYVVPRSADIVVGGTEDHGEWSRTPDPDVARSIVERATSLVPELAGARVLGHRVGLRPSRPSVRLERDGDVVHCYGHGGAGVTLSWGCADDVVELVAAG